MSNKDPERKTPTGQDEKHWARAFSVFKKLERQPEKDLQEESRNQGLNKAEIEILLRLLDAQKQQTALIDEAFLRSKNEIDQALLKNRIGETLGEYRLIDLLGSGGMSAVYLAKRADTDIQKKVAIKVLLFPSISPWILELFLQEQKLLSRLNHPNIVSMLHGALAQDNTPYLVMEYIAGARTVCQWAQDNNAGSKDIVRIMLPLCDAIAHAHSNLVVHSDIKPGNVLVDSNNVVKLLDFGIASFLRKQHDDHIPAMSPAYASPEQLAGKPLTVSSDIYSTGLLLAELLTCQESEIPAGNSNGQGRREALLAQARKHRIDGDLQKIIRKAT